MSRKLDLLKITKIGMRIMEIMGIPLYWSKYSRKEPQVSTLLQPLLGG